ncbi:MAG: YigZ family protein [Thermaerobacter sp.]|nr:YigZ family protein [Thermaerobacter sp.]
MQTVLDSHPVRWIIQGSEFIAQAFRLSNIQQVPDLVADIKRRHPGATHYVHAYRLQAGQERFFDDGEPPGTAGLPVLRTLIQRAAIQSAIVVVRYFGGTKLGRGGLVRAYRSAAQLAADSADWGQLVPCWNITVEMPYAALNRVSPILRQAVRNLNLACQSRVTASFTVPCADWPHLLQKMNSLSGGRVVVRRQEALVDILPNPP